MYHNCFTSVCNFDKKDKDRFNLILSLFQMVEKIFPADFIAQLEKQHANEVNQIIEGLKGEACTSIRGNLAKSNSLQGKVMPWCSHAVYLSERPSFTLDPSFHAGAYYVQEASSMILYHVMKELNLQENISVLDLCAAPGGKSTLVLDYLRGNGLLVANEVIKTRVGRLEENIIKWGYNNCVVTNNDPSDFKKLQGFFDVVFMDAPCSGEGMFRKDNEAIGEWSLDHVEHCSLRQKRIFEDVIGSLKEDGYLIYSTCTFNHQENIDNVVYFCENQSLVTVDINIPQEWGLKRIVLKDSIGYQCFPGISEGEGFFFSVLKKKSPQESTNVKIKLPKLKPLTKDEIQLVVDFCKVDGLKFLIHENGNVYGYNNHLADNIEVLLSQLNVKYSGIKCGKLQKKLFLPDHALALSHYVSDSIHKVDLGMSDALAYLNKSLQKIDDPKQGWVLASYDGLNLGWLKNLGNRINNYYPVENRIRMKID